MSSADAALRVLKEAGEPMNYREITKRIMKRGLWTTTGTKPQTIVNRDISQEINRRGASSRFCRVGVGMYAEASREVRLLCKIKGRECGLSLEGSLLNKSSGSFRQGTIVHVRPDIACLIAAWDKLEHETKQNILGIIEKEWREKKLGRSD
jgi:hypothetical protein